MSNDKLCPDCGHEMFIHYKSYCPVCYDPTPETIQAYDLFKCMAHIEESGNPGFKDEVWHEICNYGVQNDIYTNLHASEGSLIEKMFKHIGIKEKDAVFWISW